MSEGYTVAIVGAGLVGDRLVSELRRRDFPVKDLRVLARSARRATLAGEEFDVGVAEPGAFEGVDIAFFAGTEGEKGAAVQLAGEAISRGAVVIDNGSDFRLDPNVPLVVPEVNAGAVRGHDGLIANANCSTTQMVVTLAPLAREFGLEKVVVSTYQAVSGSGRGGVEALEDGREGVYPKPIKGNAIPVIGSIGDDGYSTEETKMREESRKILGLPNLDVVRGGQIGGIAVLPSSHLPTTGSPAAPQVILADASRIAVATTEIEVQRSTDASLQLDTAPTGDGSTPTATTVTSLWQNDLVAFQAFRRVGYLKLDVGAPAVVIADNPSW